MKPTQAQIEAEELAKWIRQLKWKSVDKDNMEFEVRTTCYVKDALEKWAAITAAAEVGWDNYCAKKAKEYDCKSAGPLTPYGEQLVAATIEHCAQVACEFKKKALALFDECEAQMASDIEAAIRKLKDEI